MINFITVDDNTIRTNLLAKFKEVTGESLKEGDARRIFLEQFSVPLVAQYNAINMTGNQNLIDYARGVYLDAIGARWGDLGARLPAQKATVTLQFMLSAVQTIDVIIPAGTRATSDNTLFFAVTQDLIIAAGNTTGTVTAESTETGEKYNGLTAGLINKIVDPVAYVSSVTNTTTSSGGADTEEDNDYKARLKLIYAAPSTAGSAESYKYWALKADSTIIDVSVISPSAGAVTITALAENGQPPSEAILIKIENILSDRRPLTDSLTVQEAAQTGYAISFTYYINTADSSQVAAIQAAVTAAVNDYVLWQCAELGRDINPDELRKRVLNAGASRLTITTPTLTSIDVAHVANNTTKTITYGGLV